MPHFIKKTLANTFWLSILLHALCLFSFFLILMPANAPRPKPPAYLKSYLYHGARTPASIESFSNETHSFKPNSLAESLSSLENSSDAFIQTKKTEKSSVPTSIRPHRQKSLLAASFDLLDSNQRAERNALRDEEPVYLIGDMNKVADPIIKLLGRALTAHFEYPPMAAELGQTGRVLIGLTLHPEGHFTDIELVSSSRHRELDMAALYAVNTAPRVIGAERFITHPKHFVVGFIFRRDTF